MNGTKLSPQNFAELLSGCESDVRSGQAQKVGARLAGLNLVKLPREFRLPLANLCRRASLLALGLKILSPVVRGDSSANAKEKAEYAVLLQRSGSVLEALNLLETIAVTSVPEARLYQAFCHFNRWDYHLAVQPLREAIAAIEAPYFSLVARVNLVAALIVTGELQEAEALLQGLFHEVRRANTVRLEANCWELLTQIHLRQGRREAAREAINGARKLLGEEQTLDELFVSKWEAVLAAEATGDTKALIKFRERAVKFRDFESIREADLYLLKIKFDESRFHHLYFGSPFEKYRERIQRELGRAPVLSQFRYGSATASRVLDITTGQLFEGKIEKSLPAGKKSHQLLSVLLKDLYRPQSLGGLFAELFPDEYYDAYSSPSRLYQTLRRARAWLTAAQIPARIVEAEGSYQIQVQDGFAFQMSVRAEIPDPNLILWRRLREAVGQQDSFTSKEAMTALELPLTSFRRFAQWAIESGRLVRQGQSTATKYVFVEGLSLRSAA